MKIVSAKDIITLQNMTFYNTISLQRTYEKYILI